MVYETSNLDRFISPNEAVFLLGDVMSYKIKTGVPIPPPLKKNKNYWMNNLTVGNSIHYDDFYEFENARRSLRSKGFKTQTRKHNREWVIWITQGRD